MTMQPNLRELRNLIRPLLQTGDLADRVEALNAIRDVIHEMSPFAGEPVDTVSWVPAGSVQANDYNPNSVAPPEMELLRLSIQADGFTQPIVTTEEDGMRVVIDGFHRNRVGRECEDVRERTLGYLPVVQIRADREDRGDRMASTIRHNRARGKHQVVAMSDIVVELKRRNWSDARIGKNLGMDPDEVLRLCQISGLAEAFIDRDFSDAWEHVGAPEEAMPDDDEAAGTVDLEWMRSAPLRLREPGWHDRTEGRSVLVGLDGRQLGSIQRSRFTEGEWFWYAFTAPPVKGRAEGRADAKAAIASVYVLTDGGEGDEAGVSQLSGV